MNDSPQNTAPAKAGRKGSTDDTEMLVWKAHLSLSLVPDFEGLGKNLTGAGMGSSLDFYGTQESPADWMFRS